MKHWQKQELRRAFSAPPPVRGRVFIRRMERAMPPPRVSTAGLLRAQAGYLGMRAWAASVIVFAGTLLAACYAPGELLWRAAALTPLGALALVAGSGRSVRCGMAELEQATCFSLRSVMLARMGILGAGDVALLCLLVPLAQRGAALGPIAAGSCLLTPYLLTVCIGLELTRRLRGPGALYGCGGAACLVSASVWLLHMQWPALYGPRSRAGWCLCALVLGAAAARAAGSIIKQTEATL